MSNQFGVNIEVDVYAVYSREALQAFAKKVGITEEKAYSLAHNELYRKEYQKLRNKLPEVKEKRKAENKRNRQLQKEMKQLAG